MANLEKLYAEARVWTEVTESIRRETKRRIQFVETRLKRSADKLARARSRSDPDNGAPEDRKGIVLAGGYWLTPREHAVVFLREKLGLSYKQIGNALKVSGTRTHQIYNKARRHLNWQDRKAGRI